MKEPYQLPSSLRVRQRKALIDWLTNRPERARLAITLTFRPWRNHFSVNERYASQTLRHYLAKLARAAFGPAGRRDGVRLPVIPVRERATTGNGKRLHYHLSMDVPEGWTSTGFADLAKKTWLSLDSASPRQNVFKTETDDGWIVYILKNQDKPIYTDALDVENMCIPSYKSSVGRGADISEIFI